MARNSPVQVVPDVCTPLFGVLGAPPKPLGMLPGRVGNSVRGLNASLLPRQREDGLHGCNGRLLSLILVGTGLTPIRSISCFPASLPLHPETVPEFRFIAPCSPVTAKSVPVAAGDRMGA